MPPDYSSPVTPGSDNFHHTPVPVHRIYNDFVQPLQAVSGFCTDSLKPPRSLRSPGHLMAAATDIPALHLHI